MLCEGSCSACRRHTTSCSLGRFAAALQPDFVEGLVLIAHLMTEHTSFSRSFSSSHREPQVSQPSSSQTRICPTCADPPDDFLLRLGLTLVISGALLAALASGGIVKTSVCQCQVDGAYTRCALLQDLRSLLSFAIGACVCWKMQARVDPSDAEAAQEMFLASNKVRLNVFML